MTFCTHHPYREARYELPDSDFALCGECRWYSIRRKRTTGPPLEMIPIRRKEKRFFGLRLEKDFLEKLEGIAAEHGTKVSVLFKKWMFERYTEEKSKRKEKETA